MRVWFISSAFPEVSEAFAGVEVRALRDAGADVQVFTLRPRSKRAAQLLREWGIAERDVSNHSWRTLRAAAAFVGREPAKAAWTARWLIASAWRRPLLLLRCLALLPRMFEIFAQAQSRAPEVVHLFWGHYPSVLGMMVRRWLPDTAVSLSLSAYDLIYAFPPTVQVANLAACVWTHAECNRAELRRMGVASENLRVAVRGIDLRMLPGDCTSKRARKIVTAGRLIQGKGMEYVLRAVALAAGKFPDVQLVVLGDGPDRERLQVLAGTLGIAAKVTFRGNVAHAAVFGELADASVFMLLSEWYAERLPNVVKEAIACRCICIVSDTPGIVELLQPFEHRFVVQARDWNAAADRLGQVFGDPARFDADRAAGRSFAIAHLDAGKVAQTRIAAWDAALRGYRRVGNE